MKNKFIDRANNKSKKNQNMTLNFDNYNKLKLRKDEVELFEKNKDWFGQGTNDRYGVKKL